MAVENKYVDTNRNTDGSMKFPAKALFSGGTELKVAFSTFELAAADDDGSIYRIWTMAKTIVPLDIAVACDTVTGGTDFELGLYKPKSADGGTGAVINKGLFMTGQTLASPVDFGYATALDGMDAVDIANYGKALWELAGHTIEGANPTSLPEYDIAYTADTVGSAAVTVSTRMYFASP